MLKTNHPLILASGSRARSTMLENAGMTFEKIPADIDEDAIIQSMLNDDSDFKSNTFKIVPSKCEADEVRKTSAERVKGISLELGKQKALHVSASNPDAYVIGSDQVLECENQLFQKANNIDEARAKLKTLRGKTHNLISSAAIALRGEIIWEHTDTAKLSMHNFDDEFLENYLVAAVDDITSCVGAYAFESHGAWLFESIDANYFTILGMPLLPLLAFLRTKGINT